MSRSSIAAVLLVTVLVGGCGDLRAQMSDVFITRESTIVLQPPPGRSGETIFEVENDDNVVHKPLLVRLDDGVRPDALPLGPDGTLEVGRPIDLEYEGEGYQVVEKLDVMRAYFGGEHRITTTVHTHLRPGTHVLLCNLPDHYRDGVYAVFEIEERA